MGGTMMRISRKCAIICGILLACLALQTASSLAASRGTAPGTPNTRIKQEVEQALNVLAGDISRKTVLDKETVFALLTDYLGKNPRIYGTAFAFAPRKRAGKWIKSAPYVYRSGERFIKKDLIESYDYTDPKQKWFVVPVKQKKPVWSKPYYDEGGGNAWMVTYSIPIFSGGQHFRLMGVVTSDVLIPKP
jgi:two-component system, sensor histidine kinase and response regulator